MKRLTLDIETSPNVADVWGLWNQNVGLNQLRESTRMISVGAKWHGDKKVHFFSDYHDGHQEMVEAIFELINEADVVIHFNGTKFDMRHLRREFLQADLGPHRPVAEIDLLRVVKNRFLLPSNKLQYVSTELLKLEGKTQHSGHTLWVNCMAVLEELKKPEAQRDPGVLDAGKRAWAMMKRYNIQDVRLTEVVYDKLRPYMQNHPSWVLHADDGDTDAISCTNCGSENWQRRGFKATLQSVFQQYQCKDCRAWFRGTKRVEGVALRGNA
jgi:hypothetical protein